MRSKRPHAISQRQLNLLEIYAIFQLLSFDIFLLTGVFASK